MMKPTLLMAISLLAIAPAFAAESGQSDVSSAKTLNLNAPAQSSNTYPPIAAGDSNMPPGSYPYDPATRFAAPYAAAQAQPADTCDSKPHGSVTAGIGYSSRMGNSNFQAAQFNTCKRYYDDNGNAHQIGISIGIGQSNVGPGRRGRGW
jgi:hypothetical protein